MSTIDRTPSNEELDRRATKLDRKMAELNEGREESDVPFEKMMPVADSVGKHTRPGRRPKRLVRAVRKF